MTLKFTGYIFCVLLVGIINVSEINSENNDTTAKKDLNFSPLIHLEDEQIHDQNHDHHRVVPRVGVNQKAILDVEKNIIKKIIDPITTTMSPIKNQTTLAHGREGVTAHANLSSTDINVNNTGAIISNATKISHPLNTTSATSLLSPSSTVATTLASSSSTPTTSNTIKLSNSTNVSTKENATAATSTTTTTKTTTTTTAATTTTTTAPTTTTTPIPKKPTVTFSLEDSPQETPSSKKITPHHSSEKLGVEEPEQPIAQPSHEINLNPNSRDHTDYIIPVVALMFAVPIIMGAIIVSYRRIRDYWSTRHYRRMDFLVDGMYND